MKKTLRVLLNGIAALLCCGSAWAAQGTLGLAIGTPPDTYAEGNLGPVYTRVTMAPFLGVFTLTDVPVSTTDFGVGPVAHAPGGKLSLSVQILSGQALSVQGSGGDDLVITGTVGAYADPLLKGSIVEVGYVNRGGQLSDTVYMRFRLTAGSFAGLYEQTGIPEIGVLIDLETSSWVSGANFNTPGFSGKPKIHVFPAGCAGTIGDFVWNDSNQNGLQDGGELGIDGAVVSLQGTDAFGRSYGCAGTPSPTCLAALTTTTATLGGNAGFYRFNGLCAGNYTITANTAPTGTHYAPTTHNAGGSGNAAIDSNGVANGLPGQAVSSPAVSLVGNWASNQTIDFGFTTCAGEIGDFVWQDWNNNGIQDGGEPGLEGASVILTFPDSTTTSVVTGANGAYLFTNLCAGSYQVQVDSSSVATSYEPTAQDQGGDDTKDSDSNHGAAVSVSLAANSTTNHTIDFGYRVLCFGAIGDYVWFDADHGFDQDPGELGLNDVQVTLSGTDGYGNPINLSTTTLTNPDSPHNLGFYRFTGLCNGSYTVTVNPSSLPGSGFAATYTPGQPVALANDNDTDFDVDFGFDSPSPCTGLIGDYVWLDMNHDGYQDAGEDGVNGVEVTLTGVDFRGTVGPITTTTVSHAGKDGYYEFPHLCQGTYDVGVNTGFPSPVYMLTPSPSACSSASAPATCNGASDSNPNPQVGVILTGAPGNPYEPAAPDVTIDFGFFAEPSGPEPDPSVSIEKSTNGEDADSAPGPSIEVGQAVIWTYVVDNTGNVPLTLEFVTDSDPGVSVTCPPLSAIGNGDNLLDTDETLTCTASGSASAGQYANVGSVHAYYDGEVQLPVQASDPSHYFGMVVETCDVTLSKRCAIVPAPPSQDFVCSDAKPIDSLSMVWSGAGNVRIKAWKGSVGSTLLLDYDGLTPGGLVTVHGYAGAPNDVFWEIFAAGTSNKLGESTFHLSCSDSSMNGPEDCQLPEGNGKNDSASLINDWRLEGMAGQNGQSFVCTPPNPNDLAWQDACEITRRDAPSCETENKPASLVFKYTGGGCGDSHNGQGNIGDKWDCSGAPGAGSVGVTVVIDPGKVTRSPASVQPGDLLTLTATGSDMGSTLQLQVGGQLVRIHTSCSQPLQVGDVFGSLELVSFNGKQGGTAVKYSYIVQNHSNGPLSYDLVDKVGDTVVNQYLGRSLGAGGMAMFEDFVAMLNKPTTNVATVSGTVGSLSCGATDSVTVNAVYPPCVTGTVPIQKDFNGTAIAGGRYIWFNSNFKPKETKGRDDGSKFTFTDASVDIPGYASLDLPDAVIIYSAGVTVASTSFDTQGDSDPSNDRWVTYVPAGFDKEVFLTGLPYQVPAGGLPGGIKKVTMTGTLKAESGSKAAWKWSAAVYTSFSSDPAAVGVKPIEGDKSNPYLNSDHVGTPENYKANVVGGAMGGGGSNYTGSWSGTEDLLVCPTDIPPVPPAPPSPVVAASSCSDVKDGVIDGLVLRNASGAAISSVKVYKNVYDPTKPNDNFMKELAGVASGGILSIDGFAAASANNNVDIVFTMGGATAVSRFHLSCSDAEMDGKTDNNSYVNDCNRLEGNGKDNAAGFQNVWQLRDLTGKGMQMNLCQGQP